MYVSDGLYEVVGSYKCRYYDLISDNEPEPEETEEEIVLRTIQGGGLHFKGQ